MDPRGSAGLGSGSGFDPGTYSQGFSASRNFGGAFTIPEGLQPPEPSNWTVQMTELSKCERTRFELLRKSNAEKLEMQHQLEQMILERDVTERYRVREINYYRETAEKQVRDAVTKLRKEMYECDEQRKAAEHRALDADMRRKEAEQNAQTLEKRIKELELLHAKKEAKCQHEVDLAKEHRDVSYKRTQEHAEERVKAMCYMARGAQDAMYRHMEVLELEQKRLAARAQRQTNLGMLWTDSQAPGGNLSTPLSPTGIPEGVAEHAETQQPLAALESLGKE